MIFEIPGLDGIVSLVAVSQEMEPSMPDGSIVRKKMATVRGIMKQAHLSTGRNEGKIGSETLNAATGSRRALFRHCNACNGS